MPIYEIPDLTNAIYTNGVTTLNNGVTTLANSTATLADVVEIERHLHSGECWFGKDPGDNLLVRNGLTGWTLTAGTGGAFGAWVQLSDGTEIAGVSYYDLHRIFVQTASAANNYYLIQFGLGASEAQVVETTIPYQPSAALRQAPVFVQGERIPANALLWARCACATNAATVVITVGVHTYTV